MARKEVWKDALYPGTWVTTKGQVFNCGPDDLRHFHDRTKSMLSLGANIPWVWEHQPGDQLSAGDLIAQWAKNTGGHIRDIRLVTPDGPLELLLDIDEEDQPKLEAIKYVSPDIRNNWRDRNGPEFDEVGPYWPGPSFAHIAVTPIPVQYPQRAFNFSEAVSLSAAGVSVCLSAAYLTEKGDGMADIDLGNLSKDAHNASAEAAQASHEAFTSGDSDDHAKAKKAHEDAKEKHSSACKAHYDADRKEFGDMHQAMADHHDSMAGAHDNGVSLSAATAFEKSKLAHEASAHASACSTVEKAKAAHGTAHLKHKDAAFAHHKSGDKQQNRLHETLATHHKKLSDKPVALAASKADDETPEPTQPTGADDNAEKPEGLDLDGGGPIQDDNLNDESLDGGPNAEEAAVMKELEHELMDLGIEFHASAHDDTLTFAKHLVTALKTHKATKGNGTDENLNGQEQNQQDQDQDTQTYPEPEVAESPPIMMSAATKPTERELALAKKLVKQSNENLRSRIATLHARGFIDDTMKTELEGEMKTIKLSMSDISSDGDIKPTTVHLKVEAYERQMKSGKPGPFVKPSNKPAPKPSKLTKPISDGVQLSAGQEEVLEVPDGDNDRDAQQIRPANPTIVSKLSNGRYDNLSDAQKQAIRVQPR